MKFVVAYIDGAEYESLREELLGLGIPMLSVADVAASRPEATVSGTYRGTAIESHTRPKVRAECVVSDDLVSTVVDAVLKHEGKGRLHLRRRRRAGPAGVLRRHRRGGGRRGRLTRSGPRGRVHPRWRRLQSGWTTVRRGGSTGHGPSGGVLQATIDTAGTCTGHG